MTEHDDRRPPSPSPQTRMAQTATRALITAALAATYALATGCARPAPAPPPPSPSPSPVAPAPSTAAPTPAHHNPPLPATRSSPPPATAPRVARSADELAEWVLKPMSDKFHASEAPPPVTSAIRALYQNDPQFIERVLAAAADTHRNSHERGRLLASLGLLRTDAAPAAERLAVIATRADDDPAWPSPAASGASVALRGIGPAATAAVARLAREAPPDRARRAAALLPGVARNSGAPEVAVLIRRLPAARTQRETVELLDGARTIDPASLRAREAQALRPRVLAIVDGAEPTDDPHLRFTAAGLLQPLGVDAPRGVTAIARLAAAVRNDQGGGWAVLALAGTVKPYGAAAGPPLKTLSADPDPGTREVVIGIMALAGTPADAAAVIADALAHDPDPGVRRAAASSLAAMGPRAGVAGTAALEAAARTDPDLDVRATADAALRKTRR